MNKQFATNIVTSLTVIFTSLTLAAMGAVAEEEHEHDHEGHVDALVYQSGGQVQMGLIDVECAGGAGEPGCEDHGQPGNVYEAELEVEGTSPGQHGHSESPGFFSLPTGGQAALDDLGGTLLPGNAAHSIDFVFAPNSLASNTSILYWDGTGTSVSWGGVANGEFFEIEGNADSGGDLLGTSVLSGVLLDSTGANGGFDTHPEYHLEGDGADPSAGFYAIFGVTNIAGLASSDPWAVVFGYGLEDEEAHEMAVASIETVVPEPGTAILMGLGLVGLAARGRRAQA